MKTIAILGSTGSIGTQTTQIVRAHSDELKIGALAAGSNIDILEKQIREFMPELVAVFDEDRARELKLRVSDLKVRI